MIDARAHALPGRLARPTGRDRDTKEEISIRIPC